VAEEVKDGKISVQAAERDYKVAVNPETWELDEERTKELRGGIE
jgi:hypothetical protein